MLGRQIPSLCRTLERAVVVSAVILWAEHSGWIKFNADRSVHCGITVT